MLNFLRKNTVLFISILAALITSIFITPDLSYISYFDFKTLSCLFSVLAVVCALKNINFFTVLAEKVILFFKTTRKSILALVYITFIGSMFIANDMALLTFLPLGFYVLSQSNNQKYMAFTFIMQNIAANLGGMLTPFGNPQNLFLYSKFNIPTLEFMGIMFPPFILSITLITICIIIFVKNEPISITESYKMNLISIRSSVYLCLFALSILIVFRSVPYLVGLVIITVALLFLDRKSLKMVDYPLLFTFVAFFIFAGNMGRIDAVREFFVNILDKSTLLVSVLSCQVISNVPSSILLSQFTDNYRELLVGVNIGGTGTLISSLASLITFREFQRNNPTKVREYLLLYTLFNFAFLAILTIFELIII